MKIWTAAHLEAGILEYVKKGRMSLHRGQCNAMGARGRSMKAGKNRELNLNLAIIANACTRDIPHIYLSTKQHCGCVSALQPVSTSNHNY